jgi:hypothetical protein
MRSYHHIISYPDITKSYDHITIHDTTISEDHITITYHDITISYDHITKPYHDSFPGSKTHPASLAAKSLGEGACGREIWHLPDVAEG